MSVTEEQYDPHYRLVDPLIISESKKAGGLMFRLILPSNDLLDLVLRQAGLCVDEGACPPQKQRTLGGRREAAAMSMKKPRRTSLEGSGANARLHRPPERRRELEILLAEHFQLKTVVELIRSGVIFKSLKPVLF